MPSVPDAELERRVRAGLPAEIELFGSAPTSRVLRLGGVIAAVSPSVPDRSLFNSVYAEDPAEVEARLDELEAAYEEAGVRAWTVWTRAGHPLGPSVLAPRGHVLDGAPRSMGVEIDAFRPPDRALPEGVEIRAGTTPEAAAVNDAAYGLERAWSAAMTADPPLPVRWAVVEEGGRAIACAGCIDVEDDLCITGVATVPEAQGRGLASLLIAGLIGEARGRGMLTSTLQASRAGAPVYAKLGFRDVGNSEMWEKRKEHGRLPRP
jgi:GNAT superfamily N-acetyltransferase